MDAPRIRYTKASDGTDLAFTVLGSGPPLLVLDFFLVGGLDLRIKSQRSAPFYEALAARHTVVLFDWRNSGLSGPSDEMSLIYLADDLGSVLDGASIDQCDVWAFGYNSHTLLQFAVRQPERIRKVVFARPQQAPFSTLGGMFTAFGLDVAALAKLDWESFTELYALRVSGWENGEEHLAQIRRQWTPERFANYTVTRRDFNTSHLAPAVHHEALILVYSEQNSAEVFMPPARELARSLPNARLLMSDLANVWDPRAIELASEFLSPPESILFTKDAVPSSQGAFRTLLFTDIEGHTSMMQRLGDAKGRDVLREHERITRNALSAHDGAEVKTMGDGFMASFGSAQRALECAIALQQAFSAHEGEPIRIRVGVNAGEPIAEDDDLFGSSVIIAARTAAQAKGGEVLVTDVVRQLVAGKGFVFRDRGDTALRGISEAVRLYELEWV